MEQEQNDTPVVAVRLGLLDLATILAVISVVGYTFFIDGLVTGLLVAGVIVATAYSAYSMTRYAIAMMALRVLKIHGDNTRKLFAEADATIAELERKLSVKENGTSSSN